MLFTVRRTSLQEEYPEKRAVFFQNLWMMTYVV
jgi:hypothetical protein